MASVIEEKVFPQSSPTLSAASNGELGKSKTKGFRILHSSFTFISARSRQPGTIRAKVTNLKTPSYYNLFPEWNDSSVSSERWNSAKTLFEDIDFTISCGSWKDKVKEWKRPSEFFPNKEEIMVVRDSSQTQEETVGRVNCLHWSVILC